MESEKMIEEQFLNDDDVQKNQSVGNNIDEGAIAEVVNILTEEAIKKMNDVAAVNNDVYAQMEASMNQPSPLYDDDYEVNMMLNSSKESDSPNDTLDTQSKSL